MLLLPAGIRPAFGPHSTADVGIKVSCNKEYKVATYRHVYRHEPKDTTHFVSLSVSCSCSWFRYDTVSGWPSRIQPLKWPILKQNLSIFGWDMTQNGNKMFWVISQPNIDGICSNMGHFKGWILLGRLDTVSYRKHEHDKRYRAFIAIVSPSRNFWIGRNLGEIHKEFLLDHPVRPSGDMPPPSSHQTNVVVLLLCAKTKSGSPSNERKKILKMRPSLLSLPPSLPPSEMASKQVSKFCFNFHIDMRCLRGCLHRRGSHVNNSACARVRLFVAWCMTIWQTWGR